MPCMHHNVTDRFGKRIKLPSSPATATLHTCHVMRRGGRLALGRGHGGPDATRSRFRSARRSQNSGRVAVADAVREGAWKSLVAMECLASLVVCSLKMSPDHAQRVAMRISAPRISGKAFLPRRRERAAHACHDTPGSERVDVMAAASAHTAQYFDQFGGRARTRGPRTCLLCIGSRNNLATHATPFPRHAARVSPVFTRPGHTRHRGELREAGRR